MDIHYKIIEVNPDEHSIVVRYFTDLMTEEMLATIRFVFHVSFSPFFQFNIEFLADFPDEFYEEDMVIWIDPLDGT